VTVGEKELVTLAVLVDAARLRWFVAAVDRSGAVEPLVRSADDDLAPCRDLGFDDQVSFLRHRLCGVLQRGSDRLWPAGKKAGLFAVLFDGDVPGTSEELTRRVAEHFALWLMNPPAVVLRRDGAGWHRIAGDADDGPVVSALPALLDVSANAAAWEVSTRKGTWQPETV
jgi:hypothetical protein